MKSKKQLIKRFLEPVFGKHGYHTDETMGCLRFIYDQDPKVCVDLEVLPMSNTALETSIRHPKFDDLIRFPVLINGPEIVEMDNGFWMEFDNLSEFVGLLEFQKDTFENWLFDLLSGKKYGEVFDLVNRQRLGRIELYSKSTDEEKRNLMHLARARASEIAKMRFEPKEWSAADDL